MDIGGGDGVRASFVLLLIGGLFVLPLVKRTFGEHVTARKFPHMIKEISLKGSTVQHVQSNELANCLLFAYTKTLNESCNIADASIICPR